MWFLWSSSNSRFMNFQTKKWWFSCLWNSNESCNKMTYTSQQFICETLLKDHIVPHMLKETLMSKLTIAHLIKMSFEHIIGHAFTFLAKDRHSNIYTSHFQLSTMPTQIRNLHNELNLFEWHKLMELCGWTFVMFLLHMHEMFYGLDKKWTTIKRKMVEI